MSATGGADSPLNFDSPNGIEEFPHLNHLWRGVRKGGPKEKRLRKVISMIPDTRKENMYGLRVENVALDVDLEVELLPLFAEFGEIGAFYRPTDTSKHIPTKYVFVRYIEPGCAEIAMEALQGRKFGHLDSLPIRIKEAKQVSFFTLDTGYITNEALDTKLTEQTWFDSSLPSNHYQVKRQDELKLISPDEVYTLRVDDLHEKITPENLQDLFRQYGELSSIYYPFDLRSRKYRGFAFIRFLRQADAIAAWKDLHNVNLGLPGSRNIQITPSLPPRYFSMDESET